MEPIIYLFFNGNCQEAMEHYARTLGGEVVAVFRNAEAPDAESRMPGSDDLVMNLVMQIGNTSVMASDSPEGMYEKPQGVSVCLAPPTRDEFDRVFDALSADAEAVQMPPDETFWAERFAMFTDRFGTPWMMNFGGNKSAQ